MILSRLRQLWFRQKLFHPLYRLFFYVHGIQLTDRRSQTISPTAYFSAVLAGDVFFLFFSVTCSALEAKLPTRPMESKALQRLITAGDRSYWLYKAPALCRPLWIVQVCMFNMWNLHLICNCMSKVFSSWILLCFTFFIVRFTLGRFLYLSCSIVLCVQYRSCSYYVLY